MRLATDSIFSNVLRNVQRNQVELDKLNQQLSSGVKFKFAHEDPVGAARSMQLRTDLDRTEKFNDNISDAQGILQTTDATLSTAVELLQRARQLAVQAANGTYTESDRALIGLEVEQILEEMVSISNTEFQGKFLYSGSETLNDSFNENPFTVTRIGGHIVGVDYNGDSKDRNREISEGKVISASIPGHRVFGAQNQVVTMGLGTVTDSTQLMTSVTGGSLAANNGYFRINGTQIYYDTNQDSLDDISDRINQQNIQVRSSVVQDAGGAFRLRLQTTNPHEMEMIDIDRVAATSASEGLLDDLQIIDRNSYSKTDGNNPNNIHSNATNNNLNVFQTLINLRDDLDIKIGMTNPEFIRRHDSDGDGLISSLSAIGVAQRSISDSGIFNVDKAIDNIMVNRTTAGSRINRLDFTEQRNTDMKINSTERLQAVEDLDFAEALIEFNQMQSVQQAALSTGARIFNLTLLDFI